MKKIIAKSIVHSLKEFFILNGFSCRGNVIKNSKCKIIIDERNYSVETKEGVIYSPDLNIYWLIGYLTYYGLMTKNYRLPKSYQNEPKPVVLTKDTRLCDSGISSRLMNALCHTDMVDRESPLKDLAQFSIRIIRRWRYFGKVSISELQELCNHLDIKLKP